VFHVAGTNGKGSTCAYLRAMLEAQGLRVHSATKPHLVRYNERIRIAGELISDEALADLLERVLDAAEGLGADFSPSFFEVTTAALLLAFAETPADACVIEVGLGGRLDATNVFTRPAACGIATLGIDHEAFLLRPEAGAPEDPSPASPSKRPGSRARIPAGHPALSLSRRHRGEAHRRRRRRPAVHARRGLGCRHRRNHRLSRRARRPDPAFAHAGRAASGGECCSGRRHAAPSARSPCHPRGHGRGIRDARWPARLQRLGKGPLTDLAGPRDVWLDGGHNPDAGLAIARHFTGHAPLHLVLGMLANKDPAALLAAGALAAQRFGGARAGP
jgi:dihydrofolate synthase/folylpolyglutamate synthase